MPGAVSGSPLWEPERPWTVPCFRGWEMLEGVLRGAKSWVGGQGVSVRSYGCVPYYLGR